MKEQGKGLLAWFILILLVLTWGSSFILIKKGLTVFTSGEVGAIRISAAFFVLLPLVFRHFSRLNKSNFKYIFLCGMIGNLIPAFLFAEAQTHICSSITGILNSLTPLFTLILGVLFFKYKTRWFNVVGVIIGLAGAAGLLLISGKGNININLGYGFYIILATILYALNINLIKRFLSDVNYVTITAFSFTSIGAFALIYLFSSTDFIHRLATVEGSYQSLSAILFLGIIGSALAIMIYNKLIQMTSILFAASITYLMPVISIMWGVFDNEIFKPTYLVFLILILTGVFLVNFKYSKKII